MLILLKGYIKCAHVSGVLKILNLWVTEEDVQLNVQLDGQYVVEINAVCMKPMLEKFVLLNETLYTFFQSAITSYYNHHFHILSSKISPHFQHLMAI